jgi:hypothetical protein
MTHRWDVLVEDERGHVIPGASVTLAKLPYPSGVEFPYDNLPVNYHNENGVFVPNITMELAKSRTECRLVVRARGRSTVVQDIAITATPAVPVSYSTTALPPGWAMTVAPQSNTGVPGNHVHGSGTTTIRVRMYPCSEVIFLSGTCYHEVRGGAPFRGNAEWRAAALRRDSRIDHGTLVTYLSCDDRAHESFVQGVGGTWIRVFRRKRPPFPPGYAERIRRGSGRSDIVPGQQWPYPYPSSDTAFRDSVISITDLYTYLDHVGRTDPGRVREVSIFSHAVGGGPVLYDTYDNSADSARDPSDLDGRIKDFQPRNRDRWSCLPLAMSSNSVWRVWGCFHDSYIIKLLSSASGRGEEEWFEVADGSAKTRTHRTRTRLRAIWLVTSGSYAGAAAEWLGGRLAVMAPPPGLGASRPATAMSVNWSDTDGTGVGKYLTGETPFKQRLSKDSQGYIDYSRYRDISSAHQPQGTPRSEYYETWDERGDRVLFFWNLREHKHIGSAQLASELVPDAGSVTGGSSKSLAGKSGHRYILNHDGDLALSEAFLVVNEGSGIRVFTLERDVNQRFNVLGSEVT